MISVKQSIPAVQHRFLKVVIIYTIMSDWSTDDTAISELAVRRMQAGLAALDITAELVPIRREVVAPLRGFDPREYVVFNWCEGLDGAPNAWDVAAATLEELGFDYSGSEPWTLKATQDKAFTKNLLLQNKIPTPVSKTFARPVPNGWRRFPALVKPVGEHCSCGISREAVVDTPQQLKERIEYVLDCWKQPALVEDFVDGVEYNVSIWGSDELSLLPIAAIDYAAFADYHDRLCTFDAKWNPESDAYRLTCVQCPMETEPTLRRRIERVALKTYRALRLRDYGRIDLRVRDGVPYVLDVNANPDITMEGGFARSARAAGYNYGEAIARILSFVAERRARRWL